MVQFLVGHYLERDRSRIPAGPLCFLHLNFVSYHSMNRCSARSSLIKKDDNSLSATLEAETGHFSMECDSLR